MLEIRDLRYEVDDGDRTLGILQGISLTIPEHKFIVVTGPNGGGKTTLAKAIMGIVEPTGGQILWNEHHRPGPAGHQLRLPAAPPVQGPAGAGPAVHGRGQ